MKNKLAYITFFDFNYLPQAITLIKSINRHKNQTKIYAISLDKRSNDILNELKIENVEVININNVLNHYKITPQFGKREFVWSLTPIILNFIYENKKHKYLIYVDADMYFLKSDKIIIESFIESGKSAYITPHFYSPNYDYTNVSGKYCVQYLIFNLESSSDILFDWMHDCMNDISDLPTNEGIGDQRFLSFWPTRYKNRIFIETDKGYYLAPWNSDYYRYSDAIFFHFQGLRIIKHKYCVMLQSYKFNQHVKKYVYLIYINDLKNSIKLFERFLSYNEKRLYLFDFLRLVKFQFSYSLKFIVKNIVKQFPVVIKKI